MFQFEANNAVIIEQKRVLETALSTNPKTEAVLRKLIRKEVIAARAKVVSSIKFEGGDPRQTRRAVRTSVYKKILGANINIFDSRKRHGWNNYEPPRKGVSGRGGNRRTRSPRTRQIMGYAPLDRGFILRWINDGTPGARNIEFTSNDRRKVDKWNKHPNTGNRGNISARNFFRGAGERALAQAADNLATLIDTELEAMLNKK